MLTRDGAKVLDFGLARTAPVAAATASCVTLTQALTSEGTVLGTPQYMSPEQIEGREADARSDIFAFGCLVYEMVTGRRAFDGKTRGSIIGAILSAEPPAITSLQPVTPLTLERIVARCFAKEPEERFQSLRDVVLDLRSVGTAGAEAKPATRTGFWVAWAIAGTSILVAALATALWVRRPAEEMRSLQFDIRSTADMQVSIQATPAVSPDGRHVVFEAYDKGGQRTLWLRSLDSIRGRALPGGGLPFWSPDSKSIAFFQSGRLMRMDLAGGAPVMLCETAFATGRGAWSQAGMILYSAGAGLGLFQVPAHGGTAKP